MELSAIYGLLGSIYLCKPTREAIESWQAMLAGDVPEILTELKKAVSGIDTGSEEKLEDLLWEYTRLFIGPYKLPSPPWESVHTSPKRLMRQDAHDEVEEFYGSAGFAVADSGVMLDHVGVELNFMSILHDRMNSEPEKEAYYRGLAERFRAEHLRNWVPGFTEGMEDAADSAFYKTVAKVTRDLLSACFTALASCGAGRSVP